MSNDDDSLVPKSLDKSIEEDDNMSVDRYEDDMSLASLGVVSLD